jgi:hypothetical protein
MDRPLFTPPFKPQIPQQVLQEGHDAAAADSLFRQVYVDKARLAAHIRQALQTRDQVTLTSLLQTHPLELGLAELVTYLSLAAADTRAIIDDERTETVDWIDPAGGMRRATLPSVIYCR